MRSFKLWALCFSVGALQSTAALSAAVEISDDQARPAARNSLHIAQDRQCSQRAGPFATQDTAWRRLRSATTEGYGVGNGIFPCLDASGARGYCFKVFFLC